MGCSPQSCSENLLCKSIQLKQKKSCVIWNASEDANYNIIVHLHIFALPAPFQVNGSS